MNLLYLDTNIFLNVLLDEEKFADFSFNLLRAIEDNKYKAITSFFTLMEIHRILQKRGKKETDIEKAIKEISTSQVEIDLPEGADIINAYELLKELKIDPADAIHLITALEQDAVFITRDKDLTTKITSKIKISIPEELL